MFWEKTYTPSQNIEALLEKENVTVEEFLENEEILQECKTLKKTIVNYFSRTDVVKRLIELIITEPSEELPMVQRFRHANMACEILTIGLPSLDEKILSDPELLKMLYSYLENEPPLNPLLSSFFTKTFSMLFTKKDKDWFLYQQTCLQLLEYIKSQNNFLELICKHFSTPVIPDLIMQMMRDVEGGQLKRNLYEWLTEDRLVERLIAIFGTSDQSDKHANVAEFLCDLIEQGRAMRQSESENDSFEPAFDGSNPIMKRIESEATIEALLDVILQPNAQESAIVSGISVVLILLKPVILLDEPNSDRLKYIHQRENEIHQDILRNVINVISPRLKEFNALLRNPPNTAEIVTTAAILKPPFGMTRLQICRLFTVLLETKNEDIIKAICETDFFETLIDLFKSYCWNNFLHNEVEKCLHLIFYSSLSNNNNSTQGSTIVNDGSFSKSSNNGDGASALLDTLFKEGCSNFNMDVAYDTENTDMQSEAPLCNDAENSETRDTTEDTEQNQNCSLTDTEQTAGDQNAQEGTQDGNEQTKSEHCSQSENEAEEKKDGNGENLPQEAIMQENEQNMNDTNKTNSDIAPSELQTHVIVNCKLMSKLIDCWQHNHSMETAEKGRRLGYMGHLIKIFKHITNCISEFEHIGALIENNFNASELEMWQSIVNSSDGELTKTLNIQSKMLANCNALETADYGAQLSKDFISDNSTWDYVMCSNMANNLGPFGDSSNDIVFALDHNMYRSDLGDDDNGENDINLFQFGRNIDDDDDDDEENGDNDGHSLFVKSTVLHQLPSSKSKKERIITSNPWDSTPWVADFGLDYFADFDSHFSSFANDLGESLSSVAGETSNRPEGEDDAKTEPSFKATNNEEYDNNANVDFFGKFTDDDNEKNEKVASSLVRNLQSVLNDSEDDYDDDDGMWTKPLGSGIATEDLTEGQNELTKVTSLMMISNGPNKLAVDEQNVQNIEHTDSSLSSATIPEPNTVNSNEAKDDQFETSANVVASKKEDDDVKSNLENAFDIKKDAAQDLALENKFGSAAANTVELTPTT